MTVGNIFSRSWTLLARNPVLIVPGAIVGVISAIIVFAVIAPTQVDVVVNDPAVGYATASGTAARGTLLTAIDILGFLIAQAYTVGMAVAAWRTGTTTLADGAAVFTRHWGRVLLTVVVLLGMSIALLYLTYGFGVPIFFFFSIYAIPAVILRPITPVEGLSLSFTFAIERFVPTLIIVIMLCIISVAVGVLSFIPLLGPIVTEVIKQAVFAFATLVIVGEFLAAPTATTTPPESG